MTTSEPPTINLGHKDPLSNIYYPRDKIDKISLKCTDLMKQIKNLSTGDSEPVKKSMEIMQKSLDKKINKMDAWNKVHVMNCMKKQLIVEYRFTIPAAEYLKLYCHPTPPAWFEPLLNEQYKRWFKQVCGVRTSSTEDIEIKRREKIVLEQGDRFVDALEWSPDTKKETVVAESAD